MIFESFFASSWEIPSFRATESRYSLPDSLGSPTSRVLSETVRLTSFSLNTSSTALARSSLLILETMSNEDSDATAIRLDAVGAEGARTGRRGGLVLAAVTVTQDPRADPARRFRYSSGCLFLRDGRGRLPEWPKGAVCKTVGLAYVGSNPTPATTCGNGPWPGHIRARGPPCCCPAVYHGVPL